MSAKSFIELSEIAQTLSAKSLEASEKLTEISRTVSYQSLETSGKMSEIWRMLSAEFSLSWPHYVVLLSIKSVEERRFYEIETSQNSWGELGS